MSIHASMLYAEGIEVNAPISAQFAEIITSDALRFVALLSRAFEACREELLKRRVRRQAELDAGILPDFLPETRRMRSSEWTVAPQPADLQDRRVEIIGPVERKVMVDALNSGANVFVADFEDSHAPTWTGTVQGQINLRDAVAGTISSTSSEGKTHQLHEKRAVLFVCPRGWHLQEKHVLIDGKPVSASLFDFGLYFFHNAQPLLAEGTAPYFYLPKLENRLEARLWNDVFVLAQYIVGIPQGTIKATVLIETILAAFEMDEILYELREHSAGLNCGRYDYIFSAIKTFNNIPAFVLPDCEQLTMTTHFLRSYSLLTIKTCHRRNAPAIGGMAACVPIKHDLLANEEALACVRADKQREVADGHDGTWIAHPALVPIVLAEFAVMQSPNQIARQREDVCVTRADLLHFPEGTITEVGLRNTISISLRYLDAWLCGVGRVPIDNVMEDISTVEVARALIWQWIHHPWGILDDDRKVTIALFRRLMAEELEQIKLAMGRQEQAAEILDLLITSERFVDFLTLPSYHYLD